VKWRLFLLSLVIPACGICQNLVPNPSFEDYHTCPTIYNNMQDVVEWSAYRRTPDYLNACDATGVMSVPNNVFGYQNAFDGNAYANLYTYSKSPIASNSDREYIGAQLRSKMIPGIEYFISFRANLSYMQNHNCLGSNNLGLLLSTTSEYPSPFNNFAHLFTDSVIIDTTGWTEISMLFVADSAYEYIYIGNFFDDANTDVIQPYDSTDCDFASYFIDGVCVVISDSSKLCQFPNDTLIHPVTDTLTISVNQHFPNAFTPNEDGLNDLFELVDEESTLINLKVFSRWGELIHNSSQGWNGKYKGKRQPVGTYVFIANIVDRSGSTINLSGSVLLLR